MTNTPQERLDQAKQTLNERLEAVAVWQRIVDQKGYDKQAVDQLAHLKTLAEKAQETVTQAEKAADPSDPQTKADIKRLEKVNKEGQALTADISERMAALHKDIENWQELHKEAQHLADRYGLKAFDPGIEGKRFNGVFIALTRWVMDVRAYKRHQEIMAAGGIKALGKLNPNKPLFKNDREKMINERYGKD